MIQWERILKLNSPGSLGKFYKIISLIALTTGYQTELSSILRSREIQTVSLHKNIFSCTRKMVKNQCVMQFRSGSKVEMSAASRS